MSCRFVSWSGVPRLGESSQWRAPSLDPDPLAYEENTVRRIRLLLAAANLVVAATIGLASPAMASDKDHICEYREMCLYYLLNYRSHVMTFADVRHIPNLHVGKSENIPNFHPYNQFSSLWWQYV